MNNSEQKIIDKVLQYKWDSWLRRPFYAFMMSLFKGSSSKQSFKKIGLNGWELDSFVFTDSTWYWSDEIFDKAVPNLRKWLRKHQISEISDNLEIFNKKSRAEIDKLLLDRKKSLKNKLIILENILQESSAFIWSAHMLEHVIWSDLKKKTPKYINTNLDKYIGDASYPEKKNALELMEEEMRAGVDLKTIVKKYGWMRARDGFASPYSFKDLEEYRANLKKYEPHVYPEIPKPLKSLYREARELVFLRTRRTDIFYELIFLARPIFKEAAAKYGINFNNLKYYCLQDLISGHLKKYSSDFSYLAYKEDGVIMDGKIFVKQIVSEPTTEIKGMTAQLGCVRGIARVILDTNEIKKVKSGDILVTYMTSPNFLQAMKLAAAFVTNEGGLTCHAAIIARELKKPCVIGTKIATKVIKDGDLLEVDANNGVVKILKR
jgi:phosphohistidine swiveling domain-containing protein